MVDALELLAKLQAEGKLAMTPAQRQEQRVSFAYGSAKLANDAVTREMVEEAEKLEVQS